MKDFFKTLWAKLWCSHQYRYLDTVKDQDLRSGYKFWADRHVCRRCGKIQTIERLERPRS